jgi:hypothetical protein
MIILFFRQLKTGFSPLNLGSNHGLIRAILAAGKGHYGRVFSEFFLISTAIHILPLPLNNLSLPSEVCDTPNLAEHYHIIRLFFICFIGNSLLQGKVITEEFTHCLI